MRETWQKADFWLRKRLFWGKLTKRFLTEIRFSLWVKPDRKKAISDKRRDFSDWSKSCSVVSNFLQPHGLYSPWNSPGKNTRVGSLSLLQGIFPTQRSNPGLLHCRQILYQLSHKGSPRILERIAYPFSSRSSQLRNQTRLSCIASRFFTNWAIRETPKS